MRIRATEDARPRFPTSGPCATVIPDRFLLSAIESPDRDPGQRCTCETFQRSERRGVADLAPVRNRRFDGPRSEPRVP